MTDPISDLLARIRNALMVRKARVVAPHSRLKEAIVAVLKDEGFIDGYAVSTEEGHKKLSITLRYGAGARSAIDGLRRVSTPGQRQYAGYDEIGRVRSGLGIAIVSTSGGLLTDRQARKRRLGGEVICEVW